MNKHTDMQEILATRETHRVGAILAGSKSDPDACFVPIQWMRIAAELLTLPIPVWTDPGTVSGEIVNK